MCMKAPQGVTKVWTVQVNGHTLKQWICIGWNNSSRVSLIHFKGWKTTTKYGMLCAGLSCGRQSFNGIQIWSAHQTGYGSYTESLRKSSVACSALNRYWVVEHCYEPTRLLVALELQRISCSDWTAFMFHHIRMNCDPSLTKSPARSPLSRYRSQAALHYGKLQI